MKIKPAPAPKHWRKKLLKYAAQEAREFYMKLTWIEKDNDGFTGWRWDKYKVELKIVCAANRYGDYIVLGMRHHSPSMQSNIDLIGMDVLLEYAGEVGEEQGFVDQYGTFYDREQAMAQVLKTGQPIDYERGCSSTQLFSEHLY
jgi:hypothetical protein